MAIVPAADGYVSLFCVEAPEVRFEDLVRVRLTGSVTDYAIDEVFLTVCEPESLCVSGFSTPIPALLGFEVLGHTLRVTAVGEVPSYVMVRLSGIRLGRAKLRFPQRTKQQMEHNNAFWGQAQC